MQANQVALHGYSLEHLKKGLKLQGLSVCVYVRHRVPHPPIVLEQLA